MNKREYAYMVKYDAGVSVCIMYSLGAYYVARLIDKGTSLMALPLGNRKYKTISGAERYMLNGISKDQEYTVLYGTETFIKEGSYWKGDK